MSDIRFIIREIFKRNKWIMWIYTIINWINAFFFFISVIWKMHNYYSFTIIFVLTTILLAYEILVAYNKGMKYFQDKFNFLDIY